MSLLDKIFPNNQKTEQTVQASQLFKTFCAYQPAYRSWDGRLYESELVRAAADAKARHISKLRVEFRGSAQQKLSNSMRRRPNQYQTWSQFLYRVSTILDMTNTCFIAGICDKYGSLEGYYPLLPTRCEIREHKGVLYLRYQFVNGQMAAIELEKCGMLTRFQYKDDFLGETNSALNPTMQLISLQNQGVQEAIKQGGTFRFMARLTNFRSPDDMKKEQENFTSTALNADSGMLLFPNTYSDIQQIHSQPYTVDPTQMEQIRTNVFNYFGVNEDILQNKAIGDKLDAFYEGVIEPFAIQLSEVMTQQTFSKTEQSYGAEVVATANRLQYMTTSNKISFVKEMCDRGLLSINEARDLLNYPPLPGEEGDVRPARGEYHLGAGEEKEPEEDPKNDQQGPGVPDDRFEGEEA